MPSLTFVPKATMPVGKGVTTLMTTSGRMQEQKQKYRLLFYSFWKSENSLSSYEILLRVPKEKRQKGPALQATNIPKVAP